MRYFIELAYDGTAYHGWQAQPNSRSLQEVIELGLKYKAGFNGRIVGCGRTDAGVHARQFFAHFDLEKALEHDALEELARGLNSYFHNDLAIKRIFPVNDNAHARFDAISRTYNYNIITAKDPFNQHFAWYLHFNPNIQLMNKAAALLPGYSDFTSFSKLHTDAKTNNCKISRADWTEEDGLIIFTITADRFLRNMVRAIVGTMMEIGRGKISLDDFKQIIESKNRQNAGASVPAHALFLSAVEYDWEKILLSPASF